MKSNLSTSDKVIRILLAIAISVLYFTNVLTGTLGIILLVVAGIFILTSLFSFCPLYSIFGISTRKRIQQKL